MGSPCGIHFRPLSLSLCPPPPSPSLSSDMYERYVRMAAAAAGIGRGCLAVDTILLCFQAPLSLMRCDSDGDGDGDVDLDAGIRHRCQLLLCSTRFHHDSHPFHPSWMQRHARPYTIISNSRITRSLLRVWLRLRPRVCSDVSCRMRQMNVSYQECSTCTANLAGGGRSSWFLGSRRRRGRKGIQRHLISFASLAEMVIENAQNRHENGICSVRAVI